MELGTKLENILSLSHDPVLVVENGITKWTNPAAKAAFPGHSTGEQTWKLLPKYMMTPDLRNFTSTVEISNRFYAVSCGEWENVRYFFLTQLEDVSDKNLLSEGMIASLLSSLCNIGLASDGIAMRMSGQDPKLGQYLSILRHDYDALNRQLLNLNTAFQIQTGTLFMDWRQTDLVKLCSELSDIVGELLDKHWAKLTFSTPLPELVVTVDPVKVERVLLNLIANSAEHTPEDGEIHLRLTENDGNVVLAVDDTGEGIEPNVLRNIFTTFESRCNRLSPSNTGAGLGLWICSGIATAHKGTLLIDSRKGKGTAVRFVFPHNPVEQAKIRSEFPVPLTERHAQTALIELSGLLDYNAYADLLERISSDALAGG